MRLVWTFPIGTVRCGTAEGLPVGLQVTGNRYAEEITLAIMRAVESELGGYQRPTPF